MGVVASLTTAAAVAALPTPPLTPPLTPLLTPLLPLLASSHTPYANAPPVPTHVARQTSSPIPSTKRWSHSTARRSAAAASACATRPFVAPCATTTPVATRRPSSTAR